MSDWTETYRPRSLSAVRGNDTARKELREWAETWDDHREAVVLHGRPGVGKTSAAHALAADMGWETVELNASDQRTADVIERFAGRAARNATLGGSAAGGSGRQLVILDEADNIHGTYDRGGSAAITRLVKDAGQPVALIANDYYEMSRGLRNACREVEFKTVGKGEVLAALRHICREEGIEFDPAALETIAERNDGDLRSAIKDLQAVGEGRDRLAAEDVVTGERDRSMGIFPFLDAVLQEQSAEEALQSAYAVDETPDDLVKWVEENMHRVYDGETLARGYDALANADRWLGRVRASQNYSYWRYATDNLAAGVAAARDGPIGGWTRFGAPQFWPSSDETADAVVRKLAESGGVSMATARRAVLPYLAAMTHHCKPRELTVAMAAWYDMDESEVSFVTGSGESTKKVASIVEDAQELRAEALEEHGEGAFAPGTSAGDGTGDGDTIGDTGDAGGAADGGRGDEGTDDAGLDAFAAGEGESDGADGSGAGGTDGTDADGASADAGASPDEGRDDGRDDADEDESDPSERAAATESDDQQSGLSDFT